MNTNIQCFSDGNGKVFAKIAEKTSEFYIEVTQNLGKNFFIHQFYLNISWTSL